MPLFKDSFEVPDELIADLRCRFLEDLNSDIKVSDKYHPNDVEQVKENDWYIARYLLHQELDVENALKMMKMSLQFRHERNINKLKKEDFPQNFYDSVKLYRHDKENNPILALRGKTYTKNVQLTPLRELFYLYSVEKAVRSCDWGVVTVVLDCTDVGYHNSDMDMIRFIMNIFKLYYPWALNLFIVYNMPWFWTALWLIIKNWFPEKHVGRVKFLDSNSILEYIDRDNLPVCMGGTCTDPYDSEAVEAVDETTK